MIKYALQCPKGHVFDDWFDSMAAYDEQAKAGALVCPECGDGSVSKALMAPNVARTAAPAAASCAQAAPGCGGCPMAQMG